jgi:hypothetical protein
MASEQLKQMNSTMLTVVMVLHDERTQLWQASS